MALRTWQKIGLFGSACAVTGIWLAESGVSTPTSQFETVLTQEVGTAARTGHFSAGALAVRKVAGGNMTLVTAHWQTAYAHAGSANEQAPSKQMEATEVCGTALATGHLGNPARFDYLGALAALSGNQADASADSLFQQATEACETQVHQDSTQGTTIVVPVGLK